MLDRILLGLAIAAAPAAVAAQDLVAPTEAIAAAEQQKLFHLPPGFEIQLVATEPEVHKPMNLRFDARGRMWVTQSLEYPFPAADGAPKRDYVGILDQFDPQGRARKFTKYVEGLNIPIGLLPTDDGAICYSIPEICFYPDKNGDDVADAREVRYGSFGSRDTHGMSSSYTPWIDGWIYACHGFSNTSEVKGADGQAIVMQSGNTYRMRADGSHIEYFTHGQVNPFGLAFDPLGNLYSADCHTLPIYQLLRGAWYPSFGKPHDGLGFGPTMLSHLHGSTGIAGVVYYTAEQFPAEYRDTVFIGNPVTGRVNHDRLERHGSTYQAIEQPDFITCDDPWFRPVDLQMGPDGALYIADFYNCIIGHYEVPLTHPRRDRDRGRIWRVVYTGKGAAPAGERIGPDFSQASPDELVAMLNDANLTVRVQATEQLAGRCAKDAPTLARGLMKTGTPTQRAHGLWILQRLGQLDDDLVKQLLDDPDRLVRVHIVKALAERPDWKSSSLAIADLLRGKLSDSDAFVVRAAAEALGRHPEPANINALNELLNRTPADDTHLIHVARIALRDHFLVKDMYAEVAGAEQTNPQLATRVADVSLGVPTHAAAAFLLTHLVTGDVPEALIGPYLHHVSRHIAPYQVPSIYAYAEVFQEADPSLQLACVRAMHQGAQERGAKTSGVVLRWGQKLTHTLLTADNADHQRDGIALAQELRIADTFDDVATAASQRAKFPDLRSAAVDACLHVDGERSVALLSEIIANPSEPLAIRQKAAQALATINNDATRAELARQLATAPERLAVDIAVGLAASPEGAELLFNAVRGGKTSGQILLEQVVAARLNAHNQDAIKSALQELTAGLPPREERLAKLIDARRDGFHGAARDMEAGRAMFKKVCAACHKVGGEGNKIGPELDGVGQRGLERLLEDVLDPNRNVDQAFRSTIVATHDGRTYTGLALREEGNVLILADNQGKEVRVPLSEIDQRAVSPISPMPANVPDLMTEAEFYHLAEFLLSQKQPAAANGAGN